MYEVIVEKCGPSAQVCAADDRIYLFIRFL